MRPEAGTVSLTLIRRSAARFSQMLVQSGLAPGVGSAIMSDIPEKVLMISPCTKSTLRNRKRASPRLTAMGI